MGKQVEESDAVGGRKKWYNLNVCSYLQILECASICSLLKYILVYWMFNGSLQ
jgi:hypothetical protein